jgi:hypothetical protein
MKRPRRLRFALGAIIALALTGLIRHRVKTPGNSPSSETPHASGPATTRPDPAKEREVRDATSRARILNDCKDLETWLGSDPKPSEKAIQARLLAMRSEWVAYDPQVLSETIGKLLDSGEDRKLGLPFKVGPHGMLRGWPTLRVFLLDALALSDPEMAMRIARGLLETTNSPDEFAVALRSLTRTGIARADDAELLTRFSEMLGHDDWRSSAGFAEAFDLARYVGSPAAARLLAEWTGNPGLRAMALNEFAAEHPAEAMQAVGSLAEQDPVTRAAVMARADPADPAQMEAVENYLRKPGLTDEEATAFLRAFPLRSTTTGFRLYGDVPAPFNRERIIEGDRAALTMVERWAADPAFEKLHPQVQALQKRLATWIEDAK